MNVGMMRGGDTATALRRLLGGAEEEVDALVAGDDEGGEVLDLDGPDRLHACGGGHVLHFRVAQPAPPERCKYERPDQKTGLLDDSNGISEVTEWGAEIR